MVEIVQSERIKSVAGLRSRRSIANSSINSQQINIYEIFIEWWWVCYEGALWLSKKDTHRLAKSNWMFFMATEIDIHHVRTLAGNCVKWIYIFLGYGWNQRFKLNSVFIGLSLFLSDYWPKLNFKHSKEEIIASPTSLHICDSFCTRSTWNRLLE